MKRLRVSLMIGVPVLLVLLIAVVTAGCGAVAQAAADTQPAPTTPQAILQQALSNTAQISAGTGDINANVTITGDPATMPAAAQLVLGQPITLSGNYSFDKSAKAGQTDLTASIAGQSIPVALKAVNGQAWLQFMGQWYQVPQRSDMATNTTTPEQDKAAAVQQALIAAGVDPSTWLSNITLLGDETIDGVATSHISATVNVSQIAADMAKLKSSGALDSLRPGDAAGSTVGSTDSSVSGASTTESAATEQELQQLQNQVTSAIQSLTLDAWVTKDTYQLRQVEVRASVVPPVEATASDSTTSVSTPTTGSPDQAAVRAMIQSVVKGVKNVSLDVTVSLAPATSPVTVTPPTDAKAWSDLQTILQGYMNLFSSILGGGSTSTSGQ